MSDEEPQISNNDPVEGQVIEEESNQNKAVEITGSPSTEKLEKSINEKTLSENPSLEYEMDTEEIGDLTLEIENENTEYDIGFTGGIEIDDDLTPEDIQDVLPRYGMYRNNRTDIPTNEFMPGDLITIQIENTGIHKRTELRMEDTKDQPRYHAISGGSNHIHTTRIQKTTMYGDWKFIAKVPYDMDESYIEMVIPFKISEYVPDPAPLIGDLELEIEFMKGIIVESTLIEEPITLSEDTIEIEITQADVLSTPEIEITSIEEIPSEIAEPIVVGDYQDIYSFVMNNEVKIPVTDIKGVGPAFERKMALKKIFFAHELLPYSENELAEMLSTQNHRVRKWLDFTVEMLRDPKHPLVLKHRKSIKPTFVEVEAVKSVKGKKSPKPSSISGIGPATEKKFVDAGYPDVVSIATAKIEDLVYKVGISMKKAEQWHKTANEMTDSDSSPESDEKIVIVDLENDPPSNIKGVGPATESKLIAAGLLNVGMVAHAGIEKLTDILGLSKASKLLENAKIYLEQS